MPTPRPEGRDVARGGAAWSPRLGDPEGRHYSPRAPRANAGEPGGAVISVIYAAAVVDTASQPPRPVGFRGPVRTSR